MADCRAYVDSYNFVIHTAFDCVQSRLQIVRGLPEQLCMSLVNQHIVDSLMFGETISLILAFSLSIPSFFFAIYNLRFARSFLKNFVD
jgi:hypothetical protein